MDSASLDQLIRRGATQLPNEITAPYDYISKLPTNNHNMRFQFILAFNEAFFHIKNQKLLEEIGLIISIFHESSLLIDDIEDSSSTRRGHPCAHVRYGVPLTINSGNLMYFVALRRATEDLPQLTEGSPRDHETLLLRIHEILIDEMLNLHHGQGLDIYWRDILLKEWKQGKCSLPTYDEYLSMVMDKTGGLFRLSVKLLGLFSPDISAERVMGLLPLANILGIIYQIRDDLLNLSDDRYSVMKGILGEDLTEAKLSLPLIHALCESLHLQDTPLDRILFDIALISERQAHPELVSSAISFMRLDTKSLSFSENILSELFGKCRRLLKQEGLTESSMLFKVVDKLQATSSAS